MARENITETIKGRKYGPPVVAWLVLSVKNGCWGGRIISQSVFHSSHSILTSCSSKALNGVALFNHPAKLRRKKKSLPKYQASCFKPAQPRRPSSCCWLDWNWVWKLWSAKLWVVLVRCQGRGCFWDTRVHCWAFWRLCGPEKAVMMRGFFPL